MEMQALGGKQWETVHSTQHANRVGIEYVGRPSSKQPVVPTCVAHIAKGVDKLGAQS